MINTKRPHVSMRIADRVVSCHKFTADTTACALCCAGIVRGSPAATSFVGFTRHSNVVPVMTNKSDCSGLVIISPDQPTGLRDWKRPSGHGHALEHSIDRVTEIRRFPEQVMCDSRSSLRWSLISAIKSSVLREKGRSRSGNRGRW